MKSNRLVFLFTLALSLVFSLPCWSVGGRPWELKGEERITSAEKTAEERQREELNEERFERTSDTDEELIDVDEEKDLSELSLDHFRTALENFPDAERFVLKKIPDGSLVLIPEDAAVADVSTATAEEIREILNDCERDEKWKQISEKRISVLAQHSDATPPPSLPSSRKLQNANNRTSGSWRSAILPTAMLFLSHITQAVAQPFAHQNSFWCPNGTRMGIVWEHFPKFQTFNASHNHLNFVPSSCMAAEHFYHQAQDTAEKVSQICFQNLEHPNNSTLQQEWENTFLQSIPFKEHWMLAEASCQTELNHLRNFSLPHEWLSGAIDASQHRQEEWMDAARWYPSIYTEEFQKDLRDYSHACVVDVEEKEGPGEGQKRKQIMIKVFPSYIPFICIEKTIQRATTVAQSMMAADHLMITLQEGEDPKHFLEKLAYLNIPLTIEQSSPYEPIYELKLSKPSLKSFAKVLHASSQIALVSEPDFLAHSSAQNFIYPNDPNYEKQTNLDSVSASAAWNIQKTSPSVITTIIDSGIHFHDDLNQNIWNNSNLPTHYAPYEYQHGFTGNSIFNISADDNHGLHCSGIIGAVGNNSLGITGITWKTQLMFCKAAANINSNIGWQYRAIMNCIDYAWRQHASIINLSCNGNDKSTEQFKALQRAQQNGVIVVTSAGNAGKNLDHNFSYPANYAKSPNNPTGLDNIVVVGAVDDQDQWWPSSNYGSQTVHLAAPGVGVLSTVLHGNTSSYERMSGTSMAVPHVAGALALMKEHFPGKPYTWLIEKLLNATDRIQSLTNKTIYGRLNVAKALEPEAETCSAL